VSKDQDEQQRTDGVRASRRVADIPAVIDGGPNMYFSLDGVVAMLDLRGNIWVSGNIPM
jgi:hypothetical protein